MSIDLCSWECWLPPVESGLHFQLTLLCHPLDDHPGVFFDVMAFLSIVNSCLSLVDDHYRAFFVRRGRHRHHQRASLVALPVVSCWCPHVLRCSPQFPASSSRYREQEDQVRGRFWNMKVYLHQSVCVQWTRICRISETKTRWHRLQKPSSMEHGIFCTKITNG